MEQHGLDQGFSAKNESSFCWRFRSWESRGYLQFNSSFPVSEISSCLKMKVNSLSISWRMHLEADGRDGWHWKTADGDRRYIGGKAQKQESPNPDFSSLSLMLLSPN